MSQLPPPIQSLAEDLLYEAKVARDMGLYIRARLKEQFAQRLSALLQAHRDAVKSDDWMVRNSVIREQILGVPKEEK